MFFKKDYFLIESRTSESLRDPDYPEWQGHFFLKEYDDVFLFCFFKVNFQYCPTPQLYINFHHIEVEAEISEAYLKI